MKYLTKLLYQKGFIFIILFSLLYPETSFSQDGAAINNTGSGVNPSAMLDINSTGHGILLPRLTTAQRNALPLPANGLLIYNKDDNKFNYYNSSAGEWYKIESALVSVTTGTLSPGGGISINATPNTPPNNSAILDIDDPSRGVLIPRKEGYISSPVQGLIFFNTNGNNLYYYTGSEWISLCNTSTGVSGATGPTQSSSGVAINTTNADADPAAILDVSAEDKGLLIPRLTSSQRDAILAVQGLTIYNTTTNYIEYYNGTAWYKLTQNIPSTPGAISGLSALCPNTSGVSYSIATVTGASTYSWVYSGSGATINGTTNSITINFSSAATSGNLTVMGINDCGNGSISPIKTITINPLPGGAPTISGTTTVCAGQSGVPYSIPLIANATAYSWTYSGSGATINGTTNTITMNFSTAATSGNLTVKGGNSCGSGTISPNKSITVNGLPSGAPGINGSAAVCAGQSGVPYSIPVISNATIYSWVYSGSGVTINGTTNTITIDFSGGATGGNLTVFGSSPCGNGSVSPNYAILVSSGVPISPTSGTHTATTNQIIWNWNTVTGATGYKWHTTNVYSSAINMGTATSKTELSLSCLTPYTRYVWAYNSCGNSAATTLKARTDHTSKPNCGIITDSRDGQIYHTVQIGTQCWMRDNLNYGTFIVAATNAQTVAGVQKYCKYNISANCDIYGGLYTWTEMMNGQASSTANPSGRQGICPAGWHIPSHFEWTQLEKTVGSCPACFPYNYAITLYYIGTNEGDNLKPCASSGFDALFAGLTDNGTNPSDLHAHFWTCTEYSSSTTKAFYREIDEGSQVYRTAYVKARMGMSVRCEKD